MKRPAKSFPQNFPIDLDFLPLMTYQAGLDEDLELYSFRGRVSESISKISPTGKPIETELGGKIGIEDRTTRGTTVKYGSLNPDDECRFTQEEVLSDIVENVEVPEINCHERGIVHDIPKKLDEEEPIQGAEEIYHEQEYQGNQIKKLRRATGLQLKNPYYIIRGELLQRGIIDATDVKEFGNRLRSTLTTQFVVPDNDKGYFDLKQKGVLLPLERELRSGKFWQDTGLPIEFTASPDDQKIKGRIYELDDRKELIGIG